MKRTMLALLVPLLCYMQEGAAATTVANDSIPHTGIFLKERNLYYQKVFTSALAKDELSDKVAAYLSTLPQFKHRHESYSPDGDFVGYLLNNSFKVSQSATVLNIPNIISFPMDAMVVIQVKDHRYRVTISEMTYKINSIDSARTVTRRYPLEAEVTRKGGYEIKPSKRRMMEVIEKYFTDLFDLGKSVIATEF